MGEGDRGWDECLALLDLGLGANDVVEVMRVVRRMDGMPEGRDRISDALEALIADHQERRLVLMDALVRYRATQPKRVASSSKNANPKPAKPTRSQ
jgi:hypothetical protein